MITLSRTFFLDVIVSGAKGKMRRLRRSRSGRTSSGLLDISGKQNVRYRFQAECFLGAKQLSFRVLGCEIKKSGQSCTITWVCFRLRALPHNSDSNFLHIIFAIELITQLTPSHTWTTHVWKTLFRETEVKHND